MKTHKWWYRAAVVPVVIGLVLSPFLSLITPPRDDAWAAIGDDWRGILNRNITVNRIWLCLRGATSSKESDWTVTSQPSNVEQRIVDDLNYSYLGNFRFVDYNGEVGGGKSCRDFLKANLSTVLPGKSSLDLLRVFANCPAQPNSSGNYNCKFKNLNDMRASFKSSVISSSPVEHLSPEQVYGFYYYQMTNTCGAVPYGTDQGIDTNTPSQIGQPNLGSKGSNINDYPVQVLTSDGLIVGRWMPAQAGMKPSTTTGTGYTGTGYGAGYSYETTTNEKYVGLLNNSLDIFNEADHGGLADDDATRQGKGRILYQGQCVTDIIDKFKNIKVNFPGVGKTITELRESQCLEFVRNGSGWYGSNFDAILAMERNPIQGLVNACMRGAENADDELVCYLKDPLLTDAKYYDQKTTGGVGAVYGPPPRSLLYNGQGLKNAIADGTDFNFAGSSWIAKSRIINSCLHGQGLDPLQDNADSADVDEEGTPCESVGGSMGWILCPVIRMMAAGINKIMEFIDNQLNYQSLNDEYGSAAIRGAWGAIIPIANIAFAIVFLITIYSTVIGGRGGK